MGAHQHRYRRPQKQKRPSNTVARERNVFAIRRNIDESSYPVFEKAAERLKSEVDGIGRLFLPSALTVTVVGFTRFTHKHREQGPPTLDILNKVESNDSYIYGTLGKLGIYGAGTKHKLGFKLHSSDIIDEIYKYEEAFEQTGYPLRNDPNSPDGPVPHCSVALMYQDNIKHFKTPSVLARLDQTAKVMGETIMLNAVRRPNTVQ